MIKRINHIAIATQDVARMGQIMAHLFGFIEESSNRDETQGIKTVRMESNDVTLELIDPLHKKSQIAGFLKKRDQGYHHVSFEVDDLDAVLEKMAQKGVVIINETPVELGKHRVAFLHPKSTGGILIELLEVA